MITIRDVEKDERWMIYVIRKFIQKHPILIYVTLTFVILLILYSLGIVMMLAATGGGCIEKHLEEQLCRGEIPLEQYTITMKVIDIAAAIYNFVGIFLDFVIAGLILFWSYIGFKTYLQYKRDNL